MKNAWKFFTDYLLFIVLSPLVMLGFETYNVQREVEPYVYRQIADAWPRLHEPTRQLVRAAMVNGEMTRWNYSGIWNAIVSDAGFISFGPGEPGSVQQERAGLQKAMKEGT
ncbi:hypothetical protein [Burkholderia cenocepacia]|uniref:hypothetical protein n=1 Tax=Burkholderia cenocepacia TaxID=95486 RepID=UPI002ABDCAB7|nr:hypothetical protein [Burkholderia cenocepacia]